MADQPAYRRYPKAVSPPARRPRYRAPAIWAIAGFALGLPTAEAQTPVDLALVLAIDVSFSVNRREFRQQRDGTAQAFLDDRIVSAIAAGRYGAVAVSVVLWSRRDRQDLLVPWQIVADRASAAGFAQTLGASERSLQPGGTSISGAIEFGLHTLVACPCAPLRAVIDISSDGRDSFSYRLDQWRAMADSAGVTINGLAITNEIPTLDRYFELHVVTGPSAFVEKAEHYDDYAEAIARKLLRELSPHSS